MPGIVDGFEELKKQNRSTTSVKVDKKDVKDGLMQSAEIRYIDGLNLTREEFEKACYVGQAVIKLFEESEIDEHFEERMLAVWKQEMKNRFSFATKFEQLELKDDLPADGVNINVYAARFEKNRPYMYLLYDKITGYGTVIDEKQFDAFDKGPFKRPQI